MVVIKIATREDGVDQDQAGLRPIVHGDGGRAIELDNKACSTRAAPSAI